MGRRTTLLAWVVLAALLAGLWRCTTLGAVRGPALLPCAGDSCAQPAVLRLLRAPDAPSHRCVRAQLDGVPAVFLLDTGTADTVLDRDVAARLGLLAGARRVLGAVNETFSLQPLVRVEELGLGTIRYRGFDAAAVDLSSVSEALGLEIAGILGLNVLGTTAFEIDFASDTLRIDPQGGGPLARDLAAAPEAFRVREIGGGLFAEVRVGDATARFLLDSGADATQVEADLAGGAGTVPAGTRGGAVLSVGGLERAPVPAVLLSRIALGGVERRAFRAEVGDTSLLGADFFSGSVLRADAAAGRATLEPATGP